MPTIPVLDDVVAPPACAVADDDVPVLTDAIDEIDVAAPDVDEGEPSDWLTPPAEDESVLGPVAAVGRRRAAGHAAPRRRGRIARRRRTRARPTSRTCRSASTRITTPTSRCAAPCRRSARRSRRGKMLAEIEDLAEAGLADLDPDVTWTRPITASPVAPVVGAARANRDRRRHPPRPRAVAAVAAAPRAVPTGAEFEALAEEIRMQVLQRIDMFTDTGLRERLGERLKPIVDRASADLVDAINQHVGEILRAYVAEAIEREIDRWRAGR